MSTQNSSGYKAFTATAAAIAEFTRVKVDSNGQISAAAAADLAIGVTQEAIEASGVGTVKLFGTDGTYLMTASGAIGAGIQVFPAAAGKIAAAGTTALNYVTLEAATADGDQIECARIEVGA